MIKKFWLGRTPMWINAWILGLVFFKLFFMGMVMALARFGAGPILTFDIATHSLIPLYIVWAIPTWRSAQIYKGRKLWSSLTKLFVMFKCGSAILAIFLRLGIINL